MNRPIDMSKYRKSGYAIEPLFINRWSPRAMSGEEIERVELMRLFEAARWAPSAYNNQPWRFLYALRNTDNWQPYLNLLVEANRAWVKNAAAIIIVLSKTTFDYNGKPCRTNSFDAGAAWGSLALQGTLSGLVVHAMMGFDYDRAKSVVNVTEEFDVEAMIAVGRAGNVEELSKEAQVREVPSGRKELEEIAIEGQFADK